MSFLSGAGGFLDGVLGIDGTPVDATKQAVTNYLSSSGIDAASRPLNTPEGQRLAAALSRVQPVAYRELGADANDTAVAAAKAHYEDQFRNGGLAGQAAVQQAQLAGDLTSRGGTAGIRQDILDSADRQQRVAAIAQNEMTQGGNAANALQASDANAALKRAVLAAQVSHANFENAYNQNAALFGLRNTQGQLSNEVRATQSAASYQQQLTDLEQQQQQAAIGKAILGMVASGASGGISTAMAQSAASTPSTITAGSLPTSATPAPQMLGNYALPGIQAGADTPAIARYSPIFNTPSAVPSTSNYWST